MKYVFMLVPILLVLLLIPLLDANAQTTKPDPPKGLSATPVSPTKILLSWTAPTNTGGSTITGYKIEFKMIPNNYSVLVPTTGNATTSYTHSDLTTGKTYIYKVSAINSAGTSDPSPEAVATPTATSAPLANVVPNSPTNLSATAVSPTKINLSWTAPSSNGGPAVTGYKIEVKSGSNSYTVLVANTASVTTTYSHNDLTTNTAYTYKVSAINPVGTSNASNEATATPTATSTLPASQMTAPKPPTGLVAHIASTTQLNLFWNAPADNGGSPVTSYKIEFKTGTGTYSVLAQNLTSTSFAHTGLSTGQTYSYKVYATNAVGTSNPSNEVSAKPMATTTPTGLTAIAGSPTTAHLSWSPPTQTYGQKIVAYKIERQLGPSAYISMVDNTGSPSTVYTVKGLKTGTAYTFVVSAITATGKTDKSNAASVTPLETSSAAPPTSATTISPTPSSGQKTKEQAMAEIEAEIKKKIDEAKVKSTKSTGDSEKAKIAREEAKKANEKAWADAKAAREKLKQDALNKTKQDSTQKKDTVDKAKKEAEKKKLSKEERELIKKQRAEEQKKKTKK